MLKRTIPRMSVLVLLAGLLMSRPVLAEDPLTRQNVVWDTPSKGFVRFDARRQRRRRAERLGRAQRRRRLPDRQDRRLERERPAAEARAGAGAIFAQSARRRRAVSPGVAAAARRDRDATRRGSEGDRGDALGRREPPGRASGCRESFRVRGGGQAGGLANRSARTRKTGGRQRGTACTAGPTRSWCRRTRLSTAARTRWSGTIATSGRSGRPT